MGQDKGPKKKKLEKKEEKEECCKHRKSKVLYKRDSSLFPTSIIKYGLRYRKKKKKKKKKKKRGQTTMRKDI